MAKSNSRQDSRLVSKLNKFSYITSLLVLHLAIFSTLGCEEAEDRKIAAGLTCLDGAQTEAQADGCLAIVEGLESESAYLIRCSANFIAQGFTGQRLASAFQGIKDNPQTGTDPMATALSFLVFTKGSSKHSADTAVLNCKRSGVDSMVQIATMAQMATFVATLGDMSGIAMLTGGALDPTSGSFDSNQIASQISNLISQNDPAKNAQLGNIAVSASQSLCKEGSSHKDNEICKNLNASVATNGGNNAAIGAALLQQLQSIAH